MKLPRLLKILILLMEIKAMPLKKYTGITLLLMAICFAVFFFSYNQYQKRLTAKEMVKHAEFIKEDVWETNYEGTAAYLSLVADLENYAKIELKHENKQKNAQI